VFVFDLLALEGEDLRARPLRDRKVLLGRRLATTRLHSSAPGLAAQLEWVLHYAERVDPLTPRSW